MANLTKHGHVVSLVHNESKSINLNHYGVVIVNLIYHALISFHL
jgi:hypothetical protein